MVQREGQQLEVFEVRRPRLRRPMTVERSVVSVKVQMANLMCCRLIAMSE